MNGKTLSTINQLTIELETLFDNVDVLIKENVANFSCHYKQDRRNMVDILKDISNINFPLSIKQEIISKITITLYWVEIEINLI